MIDINLQTHPQRLNWHLEGPEKFLRAHPRAKDAKKPRRLNYSSIPPAIRSALRSLQRQQIRVLANHKATVPAFHGFAGRSALAFVEALAGRKTGPRVYNLRTNACRNTLSPVVRLPAGGHCRSF